MDRYNNRDLLLNKKKQYQSLFDKRGIKHVRHYDTPELTYPTNAQMESLNLIPYVWKLGDKFYNVSNQYYGISELWWVISFFNKKPTDHDVKIGEVIFIPTPLEEILAIYGV
tara:strand:- start:166 stop:501 length:336 start_codon:yes stop_codon:yes gene_type:complete